MAKDQELLQAVKSNDLGVFRKLVAKIKAAKAKKGGKKYNVNVQDENGFTAFHHAALTGNIEVVSSLIELESDINVRDHKGMSPLHLAAWSGKVEVTQLLLDVGANVNACSDNGDTPLILACQHGNSNVTDLLLDKGCNSWTTNKNGESALDLACRFGHVHVVEQLLKSKEVRSILTSGEPQKTDPPLHLASKAGHVEIVRMLLEADADIDHVTKNGSCLHESALYGKTDVVKLLLEWGIDSNAVNDEGHTALEEVNLFTSSTASSDIKHLLKEAAAADRTIYAKAVRDHFNMMDSTALSFKAGDTIVVLEQNQSDRWKGKIQNGEREKVGFFPGNFVRITTPRRGSKGKRSSMQLPMQLPSVQKGSYAMVPVASVPAPTSEFNRHSARLRSFGKKERRHRNDDNEDPSSDNDSIKVLVEPALPEKGLKAKQPSIKLGTGLQYVEVAVDKNPGIPLNLYSGGGQINSKTQYTEVLLPLNAPMEEEEVCTDVPTLPRKNSQKLSTFGKSEDIWVRNTPDNRLPSLPPKTRTKSQASDSDRPVTQSTHPPAHLPQDSLNLEGVTGTPKPVASPALSRKGYEEMNLTLLPDGRETPPMVEDIWKPQPTDSRGHKHQPLAYENVSVLSHRAKSPNDLHGVLISEVGQQGEGDDDYILVNQQPSKPADPRAYENVTPGRHTAGYVTQGSVTSGASTLPVNGSYENISIPKKDCNYVSMKGVPDSSDSNGSHSDREAFDYEIMTSGVKPTVFHPYVNVTSQANGTSDPAESSGSLPALKMRDYNALFDWLEKFKLTIYIDNFVSGGFDMVSVCGITAEDLTAINIKKTGHRKKILSESRKLEGTAVFPTDKPVNIMKWLHLIGLEQYIPEFMDGGFDDMDFVHDMTLEDLETIGVTKTGHQRKIWMAVNALKSGDENENVFEKQTGIIAQENESQERKGYLETCLDGDDSGVSTDEVELENARTGDGEMDFPPPPLFVRENAGEEPFGEDSSSAESEIPEQSAEPLSGKEASEERLDLKETPVSQEVPQMPDVKISLPTAKQEENNIRKQPNISLMVHDGDNHSSPESDDDEPPPRPPPPMEPMDISFPLHDVNNEGAVKSVKDMVLRENDRIRSFSLDSSFKKPKVSSVPPPTKPKSFKKPPPPVVKPKPRKVGSFSGSGEKSSNDDNYNERWPKPPLSDTDSRGSIASNPVSSESTPSSPDASRLSGGERVRVRAVSSSSSHSSVESVLEEFEERKRSFEKSERKQSASELLNESQTEQATLTTEDNERAQEKLDEQIKHILRPAASREDLTPSFSSEYSMSPPLVSQNEVEAKSSDINSVQKDQLNLADNLMKDINNMLSDFSSELDSMFD